MTVGRRIYSIILRVLACLFLIAWALFATRCNLGIGDQAQGFVYENRLDEAVRITYRLDGLDEEFRGIIVPAHSTKREAVMIERQGVRVKVTTESGAVVVDQHYIWKEIPLGDVRIVIEQSARVAKSTGHNRSVYATRLQSNIRRPAK